MEDVLNLFNTEDFEVLNGEYKEYVKVNGCHFTDALADFASKLLTNDDGTAHRWNTAQVKRLFVENGLRKSYDDTWGDVTYEANILYSIFYPRIFQDPITCIKAASIQSMEENWYNGRPFAHFIVDLIGRDTCIDFERYF